MDKEPPSYVGRAMQVHRIDLKKLRFNLSIVGLPVHETTISDTLKVAKNFKVFLFSALMGLLVGFFAAVMLYINEQVWYIPLLIFPFAPVIINFLANYLAALYLIIRAKIFPTDDYSEYITIRTIISMFIPSLIVWCFIIFIQYSFDSDTEINLFIILSAPVIYVMISEMVHHFLYRYMIYDIDQEHYPTTTDIQTSIPYNFDGGDRITFQNTEFHGKEIELGTRRVSVNDILLLEAQGNYLRVLTSSGEFTERCLMSTAVAELGDDVGLQVHRSFWISFNAVLALVRTDGSLFVRLTSGEDIKIARPRQRSVREKLEERGIFVDALPA